MFQRGMTLEDLSPGLFRLEHCFEAIDRMREAGVEWVAVVVKWSQPSTQSKAINRDPRFTLDDADLCQVIEHVHSREMQVLLKPHLDVRDQNGSYTFRGRIGEGFCANDWTEWFAAYRSFILHYADLANDLGVAQFAVGCELAEAAKQEAHWRQVIAAVRAVYPSDQGPMTYAANHGKEATEYVRFWDALDFIGVDAYYELTEQRSPSVKDLVAAWEPGMRELRQLHEDHSKPILLTEIGWMASDGSNRTPWDYHCGALDQAEQRDCFEATRQVFEPLTSQWLKGVYFYTWGSDPFDGGPCDDGYSPYDKPAEDVIRQWYGQGVRPPRTTSMPNWTEPPSSQEVLFASGQTGAGWQLEVWDEDQDDPQFDIAADPDDPQRNVLHVKALRPWGALVIYREGEVPLPGEFTWLSFRIRGPIGHRPLPLWAYFTQPLNQAGHKQLTLRRRPIDDSRYTPLGVLPPGVWQEVRIPLNHLNADQRSLLQLCLQDRCGQSVPEFWIDEVKLIG